MYNRFTFENSAQIVYLVDLDAMHIRFVKYRSGDVAPHGLDMKWKLSIKDEKIYSSGLMLSENWQNAYREHLFNMSVHEELGEEKV